MKIAPRAIAAAGCVLFLSVAGCAATPVPPPDLVDARSSYRRAQSAPPTQYARERVSEAKVALDKAEAAYLDDPAGQSTKDLARDAQKKTALAEANTIGAPSQNLVGQPANEADESNKRQLEQAHGQLLSANVLLARRERQLVAQRLESAEFDKRAKDAMDRLAATMGAVQQESRGTVITLSGGALFASNKDALLSGMQDGLEQIAEALKAQGDHEIVVEGHTDSQGSATTNQALSDRRAKAVVTFLISRGVPGDQIRGEGVGQKRPIADNASAEGRAANRRVEIVVMPVDHH